MMSTGVLVGEMWSGLVGVVGPEPGSFLLPPLLLGSCSSEWMTSGASMGWWVGLNSRSVSSPTRGGQTYVINRVYSVQEW